MEYLSEEKRAPGRRARAPGPNQRLVGVDAAANMLGISPAYAYRLLREGALPVVSLGKRTLISIADIDAFIAAKRRDFCAASALATGGV